MKNRNREKLILPESSWLPPEIFPDLSDADIIAIDLETRDPNLKDRGPGWPRLDGEVAGIAVAVEGWKGYFPIAHEEGGNLDRGKVISWLSTQLKNNPKSKKLFHNAQYDLGWLRSLDIHIKDNIIDTMVAAPLINEDRWSYALNALGKDYLQEKKDESLLREAAEAFGVNAKSEMWRLPAMFVGPYAEQDASLTLRLWTHLKPLLDKEDLWHIFDLESSLTPILVEMRARGVRVDLDKAEDASKRLKARETEIFAKIKKEYGADPQIWANASIAGIFDEAKLVYPRTEKGAPSFQQQWLESHEHELPRLIVEARKINKARTTFIEKMVLQHSHEGRIHTEFHPLRSDAGGTVSGRISCSHPNLQQVPARDPEIGKMIRSLFIPEEGCYWGAFDYCFSEDTEVLTEEGFKLFKDLSRHEKLAQYKAGEITFDLPKAYQTLNYTGNMVHVQGKTTDLLVTPNHDCFVQNKQGKEYYFKAQQMEDFAGGYLFRCAGEKKGEARSMLTLASFPHTKELLQLTAAIQADARVRSSGSIRFRLKKPRKIDRLKALLAVFPIKYQEYTSQYLGETYTFIQINRENIPLEIPQLFLHMETKTFKTGLLTEAIAHRQLFLEELQFWDGYKSHGSIVYGTTNKENAEIVQRIAILSNRRAMVSHEPREQKKDYYTVHINSKSGTWVSRNITYPEYSGKVYCVTMPHSTVIVRRNGKVVIQRQCAQEPRITAHYAYMTKQQGAAEVVEKYNTDPDTDFHQTVADMAGITRKQAKAINLGLAYGMGVTKLSEELGMTVEEGKALFAEYHEKVPFMRGLSSRCSRVAGKQGRVRTLLGRKCRFDKWEPSQFGTRKFYQSYDEAHKVHGGAIRRAFTYKAMNRLIQGSAADMTKEAMRQLWDEGFLPHLQIHDELDFSVENKEQEKRIKEIMETCVEISVPVLVDVETGPSWGESM